MKYLLEAPEYGRLVEVYRNLHKKCYSIRDAKTKRVIYHADEVCLNDVTFKVSQAGHKRVIKERRKNVHAVVRGTWSENCKVICGQVVKYNPYKLNTFYTPYGNCSYTIVNQSASAIIDRHGIRIGG